MGLLGSGERLAELLESQLRVGVSERFVCSQIIAMIVETGVDEFNGD